jgi:hypothetical protein
MKLFRLRMMKNAMKKNVARLLLCCALTIVPLAPVCRAQTTPFLSDGEIRMLSNEISGDRAFEHIRWLSHWHRDSGMEGYFKAADYVMKAAKEVGLEDVRFVEQPLPGVNYTARSAELWMTEPVELKLADIGEHAVYLCRRQPRRGRDRRTRLCRGSVRARAQKRGREGKDRF